MRCLFSVWLALVGCGGSHDGGLTSPPRPVEGWDRPVFIVAGHERTCVTLRDGGVACWGNGFDNRLGDGRRTDSATPVRVPSLRSVVKLSGSQHVCALDAEGQTFCWGPYVPTGLVGAESHADMPVPTLLPLVEAIDVDAGDNHVCVLGSGGRMQCRMPADHPPEVLDVDSPRRLAAGGTVVCMIDRASALACARRTGSVREGMRWELERPDGTIARDLASAGSGQVLVLRANGTVVAREAVGLEEVEMLGPVAALGASGHSGHACVVLADGGVSCWGQNEFGELGDGSLGRRDGPVRVVGLTDAVAVAAGGNHSCAVVRDGRVLCWGANDRGQLGDGTTVSSLTPVEVRGLDLSAETELTVEPPPEGTCLERDSDGDGLGDRLESRIESPCGLALELTDPEDWLAPFEDDDSDADGLLDAEEHGGHPCAPVDLDCDDDRVMSFVDRDSDNDGVWDVDESSVETACATDGDIDGCDDLSEHVFGGCAPSRDVAIVSRGRFYGSARPAEVTLVVGGSDAAPVNVTLHVEDLEMLRQPSAPIEFILSVAAGTSSFAAAPDGPTFRGAVPGEVLRFTIDVRGFAYFEGDTGTARAALVLRDRSMRERARGQIAILALPDGGTCPGP